MLITEHLVFVHHQQVRTLSPEQPALLGFKGGHDNRSIRVLDPIPGRNTHIPSPALPFKPFVIGEGPGWNRVNRLSLEARFHEQLENIGFPGACGGGDNHVTPILQRADCLLLPEVRYLQLGFKTVHITRLGRLQSASGCRDAPGF